MCCSITYTQLSVVACGNRFEEAVTMIKSAVFFSKSPLHIHIFAEDKAAFEKQVPFASLSLVLQITIIA